MKICAPEQIKAVVVEVPTSKSIANRLLIIKALAGSGEIIDLSKAKDTKVLDVLLSKMPSVLDVGHAGTAFRFLTAYLAIQKGTFTLTGSNRMKQRPIGILVDALTKLGANITYLENEGFPPLKIIGAPLKGREVTVNSEVSSQFISALMLIAPYLENGLKINLQGKQVSQPYLDMTASLMTKCGVDVLMDKKSIYISKSSYKLQSIKVEKDWSAIAFWYEMVCLGRLSSLQIKGVQEKSIQGDKAVIELFKNLGVETIFNDGNLCLSYKQSLVSNHFSSIDFTDFPDLTQPYVVALSYLETSQKITGISTLKNKETNRGAALKQELAKFGGDVLVSDDEIKMISKINQNSKLPIKTYQDHRMAMAFAPLAFVFGEIDIENPSVVEKSYPEYWNQLQNIGFRLIV